jgi:hypothetical protein
VGKGKSSLMIQSARSYLSKDADQKSELWKWRLDKKKMKKREKERAAYWIAAQEVVRV